MQYERIRKSYPPDANRIPALIPEGTCPPAIRQTRRLPLSRKLLRWYIRTLNMPPCACSPAIASPSLPCSPWSRFSMRWPPSAPCIFSLLCFAPSGTQALPAMLTEIAFFSLLVIRQRRRGVGTGSTRGHLAHPWEHADQRSPRPGHGRSLCSQCVPLGRNGKDGTLIMLKLEELRLQVPGNIDLESGNPYLRGAGQWRRYRKQSGRETIRPLLHNPQPGKQTSSLLKIASHKPS